jgi:hypothetical protein
MVTDQYSVHGQCISFLSSSFLPFTFSVSSLWIYLSIRFIESGSISSGTYIKPLFPVRTSACHLTIEQKTS